MKVICQRGQREIQIWFSDFFFSLEVEYNNLTIAHLDVVINKPLNITLKSHINKYVITYKFLKTSLILWEWVLILRDNFSSDSIFIWRWYGSPVRFDSVAWASSRALKGRWFDS